MKKTILSICLLVSLVVTLPAVAQSNDYGLGKTADAAGLKNTTPVTVIIGNVIGTALSMIAVIFFILMVYGGFLWMTAHGNNDQVKKAQDTIIAAVIGIIIVLASYAITNFVFQSVGSGGGGGPNDNTPAGAGNGDAPANDEPCNVMRNEAQCNANTHDCIWRAQGTCVDVS